MCRPPKRPGVRVSWLKEFEFAVAVKLTRFAILGRQTAMPGGICRCFARTRFAGTKILWPESSRSIIEELPFEAAANLKFRSDSHPLAESAYYYPVEPFVKGIYELCPGRLICVY